MQVLVTGATGFIGAALARRMAERGDAVRALVRSRARGGELQRAGVELREGALEDAAALARAVEGCDAVVHLAGAVKAVRERTLYEVNAVGTRRVAEACAGAARPPRLVYVSSLAAAGPSMGGRARVEEDPPRPVSAYGRSKLSGEMAVRQLAGWLEASVVRPPIVYGPGDRELVPQLMGMAHLGVVPRMGRVERRYSLVHVADLCEGILAVLDRGRRLAADPGAEPDGAARGVYFLDDGRERSWEEIALAACAAAGRRATVVTLPAAAGLVLAAASSLAARLTGTARMVSLDKHQELRQTAWTCSSARARLELGWAPQVDLGRGMAGAVAWFEAGRPAAPTVH